jgi:23S rRNA pseudouridine1911/1915/1917 synthase
MSKYIEVGDIKIEVLYEDDRVIVINKPAGIAMHPKNEEDDSITISSIFKDKLAKNDPLRGGIVHRIDKDTSGVVIMAKETEALEYLQAQFASREVDKTYVALVWGHLAHEKARIELPVQKSLKAPNMMSIHPAGKMSISEYQVLSSFKDYSLLEVNIHTGRTHQIRVQMAHMGHPVVGDRLYSNRPTPSGLKRQFLHSQRLSIKLPGKNDKTIFEANLPNDLRAFLKDLK